MGLQRSITLIMPILQMGNLKSRSTDHHSNGQWQSSEDSQTDLSLQLNKLNSDCLPLGCMKVFENWMNIMELGKNAHTLNISHVISGDLNSLRSLSLDPTGPCSYAWDGFPREQLG